MRHQPDFIDESVRTKDRVRKLELKSHGGGGNTTPWEDLDTYLDADIWIPATHVPQIRLNNGRAELRGLLFAVDNHGGASIFTTPLPSMYRAVGVVWTDVFFPIDDDSADVLDYYPPRGGWSMDVGGTASISPGHIFFDAANVLINQTVGPPVLVYSAPGVTNQGWPLFQTQILLDGVSWAVG